MTKIIDKLLTCLSNAALCNADVQAAPQCILWTDRDRQWTSIIPRVQKFLPELFVLGEYDPKKRMGPAIWLRCVIAGKIVDTLPAERTPIIYLPGISRQDLRAVESCPDALKPLAELQYRGTIWSQVNAKDWTVLAFLNSRQGGLGLEIAQDQETKNAMLLSLGRLMDEGVEMLADKHLDHNYFNNLLSGGDPVRELLLWLDLGDEYRAQTEPDSWKGFINICKSTLAFHPEKDGPLIAAERLAKHEGVWQPVWQRFCEAPTRFSNIPTLIRKCKPPRDQIFWLMPDDSKFSGWPQWNEDHENALRGELSRLGAQTAQQARARTIELEKQHGPRRKLVWAELGEAPLALSLQHLAVVAEATANPISAGECADLAASYQTFGWCADDAVVKALSYVEKNEDLLALTAAIRAMYLPWCEESARHLQRVVAASGYPGISGGVVNRRSSPAKECVLFVDGMRFDVAKRLSEKLAADNCLVQEQPVWSALPSVTPTGKPAVSPVREKITGLVGSADFTPVVAEGGQAMSGYHFKKLLTTCGWEFLEHSAFGAGQGNAWCEFGDIDKEGHSRNWKLCKQLDNLINEIYEHITQLLSIGCWKTVRVVTDHGWLLMPGGLPKIDLPSALAENKWGRCAAVKPGATIKDRLYPWYWNSQQNFALADGISCFYQGPEYAHGGLSLQECLNLELVVSRKADTLTSLEFDVTWRGMRCTIELEVPHPGLKADLRIQPGDPASSVANVSKPFKENGTVTLIVENEDLQGQDVFVVLRDQNESIVAQRSSVIGG